MRFARYEIHARKKDFPVGISCVADFVLKAEGTVRQAEIVKSEQWSLYCIDFDEGVALFARMPEGSDLAARPFVYMTQFELATHAAKVPLSSLDELANQVDRPRELSFIFSTGRCGSTLASKLLDQIPGVLSISEPDYLTNLAFQKRKVSASELDKLAAAATRLASKRSPGASTDVVVLKPRSEATVVAENLARSFPEANRVFLYRDAIGYVNSLYKYVQRVMGRAAFDDPDAWKSYWSIATINAPLSLLNEFFPNDAASVGHTDILALCWWFRMQAHSDAGAIDVGMVPIHYDDLNSNRRVQTRRLLNGCGIDAEFVDQALKAFERDSHAGSAGENTVPAQPLSASDKARVSELVRRWGLPMFDEERLGTDR